MSNDTTETQEEFDAEMVRFIEANRDTAPRILWEIIGDLKIDNHRLTERLMQLGASEFMEGHAFRSLIHAQVKKELGDQYTQAIDARDAAKKLHAALNTAVVACDRASSVGEMVTIIRELHGSLKEHEAKIFADEFALLEEIKEKTS